MLVCVCIHVCMCMMDAATFRTSVTSHNTPAPLPAPSLSQYPRSYCDRDVRHKMCNYKARAGLYSPLCLDNALAAARLIIGEDKAGQPRK